MTGAALAQRLKSGLDAQKPRLLSGASHLGRILLFNPADNRVAPKRALAAAIDSTGLTVVSGSRFLSRIRIKRVKTYRIDEQPFPQPETVASTIALAVKEMAAKGRRLSLCIPKSWSIIKQAGFPLTVKTHLSDVVSFEIDRLTPFTAESVHYDFRPWGEDKGKLNVIITLGKAATIDPYLDAIRQKGIAIERLTVNPSALSTLGQYLDGNEDAVFVAVKDGRYEGGVTIDRLLVSAFAGTFDSSGNAEQAEGVLQEIRGGLELLGYQGKTPRVVILSKEGTFSESLKKALTVPVSTFEEMKGHDLVAPKEAGEFPPGVTGALLESLWPKSTGVDLLGKGRPAGTRTPWAMTLLLAAICFITVGLYVVSPVWVEEKRMEQIDRQIALRKPQVKQVEALKKEVEAVDAEISAIGSFKGENAMLLDVIKELTEVLPRSVWLSRIHVLDDKVELEGYAASATEILPKLEASKYFEKAEFSSPTQKDPRTNIDRFSVRMQLEGRGKKTSQEKRHETKK